LRARIETRIVRWAHAASHEDPLMTMAAVNYWSILVAAVAAWLLGAVYYTLLGRVWLDAQGKTVAAHKGELAAKAGTVGAYAPFVLAFVAELIMAFVLSGVMRHVGPSTIRSGIISGLFVWFGFVVTTMAVNNAYTGRRTMLTVIDAGHWLLVLVAIGIVLGAFG
jgi:hypothetical protein